MTRSSSSIATPEIAQLAHLKAMSDAAQAHKFFQDNPKVIDQLASKITGAYALSEAERKERDDAVQAVTEARTGVKTAKTDLESAQKEAILVKKDADTYSKNVKTAADDYKKDALAAVAREQQKIIDDKADVKKREDKLADDLKQLGFDQKKLKDDQQEIADWKAEKEGWEQDYTERSAKLDVKLRKAVKG